jgi:hypothetical protein
MGKTIGLETLKEERGTKLNTQRSDSKTGSQTCACYFFAEKAPRKNQAS